MTMARFGPSETIHMSLGPGMPDADQPAVIMFIREVNGIRPGTFGTPDLREDYPRAGYHSEVYPNARIIRPNDPRSTEGTRVVVTGDDSSVAEAFRMAARRLGIHLADPEFEPYAAQDSTMDASVTAWLALLNTDQPGRWRRVNGHTIESDHVTIDAQTRRIVWVDVTVDHDGVRAESRQSIMVPHAVSYGTFAAIAATLNGLDRS